jgi:hypothetical protein
MATTQLLGLFEVPRIVLEPMRWVLRAGNTLLDTLFYDVNDVVTELLWHGLMVTTIGDAPASGTSTTSQAFGLLNLGALSNPEGSLIVVDAGGEPHVQSFADVPSFLKTLDRGAAKIETMSITGVGSSALGSVAFAWNLSTALDQKVAAIVPGDGVADVVQQALGGWFGFGLHGWWLKQAAQSVLARAAPATARIGRRLMMTVPGHEGIVHFQHGSGSSDVLHAVLKKTRAIKRLVGHSKGALAIENAVRDLEDEFTRGLEVVTFGCPISEDAAGAKYLQFLGMIDGIGWLNAWGNLPDMAIFAHHGTNTTIPLSMPVTLFTRFAPMSGAGSPRRIGRMENVAS